MIDDAHTSQRRILTIGHSNHSPEALIELLNAQSIQVVADVRSAPYSRHALDFNKGAIERILGAHGIRYVFLGDLLGGRPKGDEFYDDQEHVLYDRVAQSAEFLHGIDALLAQIGSHTVAVLCSEENPSECHRRLLVGRVLGERGVDVVHIRGDGRLQSESELRRDEEFRRTQGQMALFETEETEAWRSTRSVSQRKGPPSSSTP